MPRRGPAPYVFPKGHPAVWGGNPAQELEDGDWWSRLGIKPSEKAKAEIVGAIELFRAAVNDRQGISLDEMERKVRREIKKEKAGSFDPDLIDPEVSRQMDWQNFQSLTEFLKAIEKDIRLMKRGLPGDITMRGEDRTYAYIRPILKVFDRYKLRIKLSDRDNEETEPTEFEKFFDEFLFHKKFSQLSDEERLRHRVNIQNAIKKAGK